MNNRKCTNCGLVNYPSATTCGRCGQAFSASPFVDAVFADSVPREPGPSFASAPYAPAPYARQFAGETVGRDEEHLRLLSIFHYIVGGILGLTACIPIIHFVLGLFFVIGGAASNGNGGPPAALGLIFMGVASVLILIGWTVAGSAILAGRFIKQRRRHTFCVAVACVLCLFMPLGAILGIFSLIVLNRVTVKSLFT